jgi:hypothetical protein
MYQRLKTFLKLGVIGLKYGKRKLWPSISIRQKECLDHPKRRILHTKLKRGKVTMTTETSPPTEYTPKNIFVTGGAGK